MYAVERYFLNIMGGARLSDQAPHGEDSKEARGCAKAPQIATAGRISGHRDLAAMMPLPLHARRARRRMKDAESGKSSQHQQALPEDARRPIFIADDEPLTQPIIFRRAGYTG